MVCTDLDLGSFLNRQTRLKGNVTTKEMVNDYLFLIRFKKAQDFRVQARSHLIVTVDYCPKIPASIVSNG